LHMKILEFSPFETPPGVRELRQGIRTFLHRELAGTDPVRRANCWMRHDADFSRALGQAGFIGMVWPKRFGGHDRSPAERYIVLEELLAAGAPVCAHWVADRQSGPLILKYGTEQQKQRLLPGIVRGETYFCIGLSEPGAGSDLASVRTHARRVPEGWRISGQKIWTTNAHRSQFMIALVRTGSIDERQAGLSQFIIDLSLPGLTVKPIVDLTGASEFNEVWFDDVLVPEEMLIGEVGQGWKQVTAELALERSGPERYLTSFSLLKALIHHARGAGSEALTSMIGQAVAELWTLRQMSMSTAAKLAKGQDPSVEAAIVKDLGTGFEQSLPVLAQDLLEVDLSDQSDLARLLAYLLQVFPSFSLRGGTREILRGIIARGLGLR
jgi:alkylation response protein AidB-like acyl-CoA dehydrogenase